MQRKSPYRTAILSCVISGIITFSSACARDTQPPIVTEKTEPTQGQEQSQEAPSSSGSQNLSQMLDCPEQYIVSREGKLISLTADAPVIVPKVNEIPVKRVTRQKVTKEDYKNWKDIISKDYGNLWRDDQADKQPDGQKTLACTTQDEMYSIHLSQNTDKDTPDLLWLAQDLLRKADNAAVGTENSRLETALLEKAETQIKSLTQKPMILHDMEWKSLEQYVLRDGTWYLEKAEETDLCLTYVPSENGIPIMPDLPVMAKDSTPQQSGMELSYTSGGTLLSVRAGAWNYEEIAENDHGFLLPFAVIAEVLEEYYVNFYQTPGAISPKKPDGEEIPVAVSISRVQLEYAVIWDGAAEEGLLIPVWNFYGYSHCGDYNYTAATAPPSQELLLTIDARDGSLPFEMEQAW